MSDIITTDVCLGYHPDTGAQPNDENIEHGFHLNLMFIDMLVKYDFAVVVICLDFIRDCQLYHESIRFDEHLHEIEVENLA